MLYTAFLVFLVLGIASSVWLYRDSFGSLGADAAATYYLGDAAGAAAEGGPALDLPDGGPALDLPDEGGAPAAATGGLQLEKSPRQVLETFHFHLFTVPVVLLIVGHLFMLTSLSLRLKIAAIVVASVGTFVHLLAPLAVRFGGPAWSWLMPVSVIAASIGWLPLTLWPLWEMWTRLPQRAAPAGP